VQAALETVDGVEDISIDFNQDTKSGVIRLTCNSTTKPAALISALEADGYGGSVK